MTQRVAGGRTIFNMSAAVQFPKLSAIPTSFFPVDSAIQMRDEDSQLSVTVMNDRA
jgi:hypothetical protein